LPVSFQTSFLPAEPEKNLRQTLVHGTRKRFFQRKLPEIRMERVDQEVLFRRDYNGRDRHHQVLSLPHEVCPPLLGRFRIRESIPAGWKFSRSDRTHWNGIRDDNAPHLQGNGWMVERKARPMDKHFQCAKGSDIKGINRPQPIPGDNV
jgi:hypothetical protein